MPTGIIKEKFKKSDTVPNCLRNHHTKFEIGRTILKCQNHRIKKLKKMLYGLFNFLVMSIELLWFLNGT